MGGDKSMAYPLAQHSSQIIQPLTKYKAPRNNHLQLFLKIGTKQTKPISTTLTNSSFYKLFFFLGPWTKFTHAVELLCTLWGKQKEKEKR